MEKQEKKRHIECSAMMRPVRDALEVINGKWKLMILISISSGNKRFKEIERSIHKINPKVLAKELKDLEEHQLIKRTVYEDFPFLVEYTLLPYAETLENVIKELSDWGINHRKHIHG